MVGPHRSLATQWYDMAQRQGMLCSTSMICAEVAFMTTTKGYGGLGDELARNETFLYGTHSKFSSCPLGLLRQQHSRSQHSA